MKYFIAFFEFNNAQRKGVIFILLLTFISILLPTIYDFFNTENNQFKALQIDSLLAQRALEAPLDTGNVYQYKKYEKRNYNNYNYDYKSNNNRYEKYNSVELRPQKFDPNSASEELLTDIGLKKYVINNIIKYRTAGGGWRSKADFKTVYGLDEAVFDKLFTYIDLPDEKGANKANFYENKANKYPEKPARKAIMIEINTADTTAFATLPMIGNKLASRIVKYRESLGGFIAVQQVKEVFGIRDSTWLVIADKLQLDNTTIQKINLNTATEAMLRMHPYIKSNAKMIVAYRTQHGNYTAIEDLKKIKTMDSAAFEKIKNYVTL